MQSLVFAQERPGFIAQAQPAAKYACNFSACEKPGEFYKLPLITHTRAFQVTWHAGSSPPLANIVPEAQTDFCE